MFERPATGGERAVNLDGTFDAVFKHSESLCATSFRRAFQNRSQNWVYTSAELLCTI
jgi:hypothetical protein